MTAGDNDMVEGSISSVLVDSLESNQNGDALSPEEVAWVDSCLVKDPEVSDTDWNSLKGVLLEILSLQSESHNIYGPGRNDLPRGTNVLTLPSNVLGISQSSGGSDDEASSINKEKETKTDGFSINAAETDFSSPQLFQGEPSETSLKHAFSPNYKEDDDFKLSLPVDPGADIGFLTSETEPSTEDIFKVWDLGIPDEEDELVKQLNKALSEDPAQSTPPTSDDSRVWKDLKEESLDTLINGIADLSLDQLPT